jgi:hypothetical protein
VFAYSYGDLIMSNVINRGLCFILCSCGANFSLTVWKHHCRACGQVFCEPCSSAKVLDPDSEPMRVIYALLYSFIFLIIKNVF